MKKLSFVLDRGVTLAETQTYIQSKLATGICSTAEKRQSWRLAGATTLGNF